MASLLEGPVYTRPRSGATSRCPAVLQSGTTRASPAGGATRALRRTATRRPELLAAAADLDRRDREVLDALEQGRRSDVAPWRAAAPVE
jgi:tRNA (guanine37-N1)-methyltransferase